MKDRLTFLDKYFLGNGRASRKEFWIAFLLLIIFVVIAAFIGVYAFDQNSLAVHAYTAIVRLLNLTIFASIMIRRLRDIGKSGWWWLLAFTIVGFIPLLYWATKKGISDILEY